MIRIIIAGTRTFNNQDIADKIINIVLDKLYKKGYKSSDIEIISGGAKGADSLGAQYGKINNIKVSYFLADWNAYGKSAGCIRNQEMADYAGVKRGYGALIAFWDKKSKGTKNMIEIATRKGLKVYCYNYTDKTWFTRN